LTADEVRTFCNGKIAHNKIPRYVEFVDEFPMTVTGKILPDTSGCRAAHFRSPQ